MSDNAYSDHFTPIDRRELIETGVNLKNLRDDFAELKKSLADGDTRFTAALNEQRTHFEKVYERMDGRVRSLENYKWWMMGLAAGIGALGGYLTRFFHT